MSKKYVIGIDEVGRGCLAGPVVVGAVLLRRGERLNSKKLGKVRDSKKLTVKAREEWAKRFKEISLPFATARVYPAVIDKINISKAANLAALRVFTRLAKANNLRAEDCPVYLDGGLYLGDKSVGFPLAETIVRGDQKIKAIAAASIIAKVSRDKFMVKLAKKYPEYGLDVHKGYGTKKHIEAIKRHGLSDVHRRSFTKNVNIRVIRKIA